MGAGRETANIWWYIKRYGIKEALREKVWKKPYFWQDSFLTQLNRAIGCRVFGHRNVQTVTGDYCGEPNRRFCFACYRDVEESDHAENQD